MNSVQVRQVPITPSTSPERASGAWFSTGYYGHFRAKPRIDLCNSFRQLARPNPPNIFVERQTSAATTHKFSDHDNRHTYQADPIIRGSNPGFGRKRCQTRAAGKFDPFLIGWLPKNADRDSYIDELKISCYANDYSRESSSPPRLFEAASANPSLSKSLPDIQPGKPSSSGEGSIYQIGFSHGQPNAQRSKQIREETFQRYAGTAIRRAKIRHIDRSTDVATCLAWNSSDVDSLPAKISEKVVNADSPAPASAPAPAPAPVQPARINSTAETSVSQPNIYHSESMPTFKHVERSYFNPTPSREYQSVTTVPTIRRAMSFIQPPTNSLESLVAKYM